MLTFSSKETWWSLQFWVVVLMHCALMAQYSLQSYAKDIIRPSSVHILSRPACICKSSAVVLSFASSSWLDTLDQVVDWPSIILLFVWFMFFSGRLSVICFLVFFLLHSFLVSQFLFGFMGCDLSSGFSWTCINQSLFLSFSLSWRILHTSSWHRLDLCAA